MRDDANKFVNNKDFGYIAQSSRGSNTPKQIGDQNLREAASGVRDSMKNEKVGYFATKGGLVDKSRRKGGSGK